jgi:hypothetical protein
MLAKERQSIQHCRTSNAVEGSLTIINELFGEETTNALIAEIHYPDSVIKTIHQSVSIDLNDK